MGKIDQWLRDHHVTVIRDTRWFPAGTKVPDSIRNAVIMADKVVAVYSANSRSRDWPILERHIAEQLEKRLGRPILIYLNLDGTPLPKHDPNRLAVLAKGRRLGDVGNDLLYGILEKAKPPETYIYDDDEIL